MKAFTPQAVKAMSEVAKQTARDQIAILAPRGKCEFVADFAKILPIHVFLGMVNLPVEDKHYLLPLAEISSRSPSVEARAEAQGKMMAYLDSFIDERMANPGDDLLSMIGQGEIDGRPITVTRPRAHGDAGDGRRARYGRFFARFHRPFPCHPPRAQGRSGGQSAAQPDGLRTRECCAASAFPTRRAR